jgi:hypothetical protein
MAVQEVRVGLVGHAPPGREHAVERVEVAARPGRRPGVELAGEERMQLGDERAPEGHVGAGPDAAGVHRPHVRPVIAARAQLLEEGRHLFAPGLRVDPILQVAVGDLELSQHLGLVEDPVSVRLALDAVALPRGEHAVDVGLFSADWETTYDYHWRAYRLRVQPPVHRWSVEKGRRAGRLEA